MSLHHTNHSICELCEQKLSQAHRFLSDWFSNHVKPHHPDAHVSWSYRDRDNQEQCVLDGKSNLHFPNSPHNKTPALALDLFEIDENGEGKWDPKFFIVLNSYNQENNIPLIWGGTFKHLGDRDHFQYVSGELCR